MPSFVEIYPPVLKKIFFRVFSIYGHGRPIGGHLGHVTWIIYIHIGPLSYKFEYYGPSGSREDVWILW